MNLLAIAVLLPGLAWGDPRPSPALDPGEVVRIVVDALGHNNSPIPNAGIFTAYRFASPANHAVTGPYARFLQIAKGGDSASLLSGRPAEFSAIDIRGGRAVQTVRIPGQAGPEHAFRFVLSRQTDGACRGCWMVDGVIPLQ